MSISYRPAKLRLQISAQNYLAQTANKFLPQIIESVAPFVGQKIYRATGERGAKFSKSLFIPDFKAEGNQSYNFWLSHTDYRLKVEIRVSAWLGQDNVSAEDIFYIGNLTDGGTILKEIIEHGKLREDWDYEEITAQIVKTNLFEAKYEDEKRKIPHFLR